MILGKLRLAAALAGILAGAEMRNGGYGGFEQGGTPNTRRPRSLEENLRSFTPEAIIRAQEKRDRRNAKRLKEGR